MTHLARRTAPVLAALVLALAHNVAGRALAVPPSPAVDDTVATDEDTALTVTAPGVLANDVAPSGGNELCVAGVDQANLHGSLDWNADGSFAYTPSANYNGAGSGNSFTYTMYEVSAGAPCDGPKGATATVEITVNPVNDAPTAVADSFQALRNITLNIGAPGVLSNDQDIDGDSLTAQPVNGATHGVAVLAADGSFSYTPATNFTGADTFSYRAFDGQATSATRVVTIIVSSIAPISTPTPIPAPTPSPTPEANLTPILTPPPVDVTVEPGQSPTPFIPPTPQLSGGIVPTAGPASHSVAPGRTAVPNDTSDSGFGSPLAILLGVTLLSLIAGVAAAVYGPGWLEARRRGRM